MGEGPVEGHRDRAHRPRGEPADRGQPPSYHHEIASLFGRDGAWGTWVHRWTAEEGRHGIVMRDYLLTSRAVDPDKLEQFRMSHMSEGFESDNRHSMLHSVAYVAFQELATRISHRNTGHQSGDPVCDRMLARIATDENLHMVFYRNLLKAAFELAPDLTMQAVRDVVVNFRMPDTASRASSGPPRRWRSARSTTCASTTTT